MIDITKYEKVIDTINTIISGGRIAEVKTEKNGEEIVVLEVSPQRTLKIKEKVIK